MAELSQECTALSHQEMGGIVGGDIYYLDQYGHLDEDKTVLDSGVNKVVVTTSTGREREMTLDASTSFTNVKEGDAYGNDQKYDNSGMVITNASYRLFEFLAQNTEVEWAISYTGKKKNWDGVVNTSHQKQKVEFIPLSGYSHHVHYHPSGLPLASDNDMHNQANYNHKSEKYPDYDYSYWGIYYRQEDRGYDTKDY
ncbi:MAG: hypothetical protein NC116_12330 [Clostridium sp.]|nr:hypothetical protein [Clostridium sp.]